MAAKQRILVIDDDEDFRASVGAILEHEGYEVATATSGREGLETIERIEPDLVIVDVMMDDPSDGYGVTQAIKFQPRFQKFQGVPILMISSIQESPDDRFGGAGEVDMIRPDRYLTKPLDVPRFVNSVRQLTVRA